MDRYASVQRQTQETAISVEICLDSGERDIFEVIGDLITDSFCSSEIHKLTKESSVDLDMDMEGK